LTFNTAEIIAANTETYLQALRRKSPYQRPKQFIIDSKIDIFYQQNNPLQ